MTRDRIEVLLAEAKASAKTKPLSLRLGPREHARLFAAAKRQGIAAATLARVLVVAGLEDIEAKR